MKDVLRRAVYRLQLFVGVPKVQRHPLFLVGVPKVQHHCLFLSLCTLCECVCVQGVWFFFQAKGTLGVPSWPPQELAAWLAASRARSDDADPCLVDGARAKVDLQAAQLEARAAALHKPSFK